MGERYSKTRRVFIWFGGDNELSQRSSQSVEEVNSFFPSRRKMALYRRNPRRLQQVAREPLTRDSLDSLLGRRILMKYNVDSLIEMCSRGFNANGLSKSVPKARASLAYADTRLFHGTKLFFWHSTLHSEMLHTYHPYS
jgi:hypothetical protein